MARAYHHALLVFFKLAANLLRLHPLPRFRKREARIIGQTGEAIGVIGFVKDQGVGLSRLRAWNPKIEIGKAHCGGPDVGVLG